MCVGRFKRTILAALNRSGYVLLKTADYEKLRAPISNPAPPLEPIAAIQAPEPESSGSVEAPGSVDPPNFIKAGLPVEHVGGLTDQQASELFDSVRDLVARGITGVVVDCCDGSADVLVMVAATLQTLGDTRRQLVLVDTSGDPNHRAELNFQLWGEDIDLIGRNRPVAEAAPPDIPPELLATGYPAENITVIRFPFAAAELPAEIAFLSLIPDRYLANRATAKLGLSKVKRGGIIVVIGPPSPGMDAFALAASELQLNLPLRSENIEIRIAEMS